MSRTLRKQMLTMTGLLRKANQTLRINLTGKKIQKEKILELLTDCQETAIAMGQEIEAIYGEGTESVQKLEEYCESLYQMTLVLSDLERRRGILRDLTGQIQQFQNLVSEQISDKLEVVFLPYKAAMWDSLESVWMAAAADENCETYVVPIPYYERNPDGTFSKYHYEGEELPDYVPVTYYENYEIEKRWPDIVYIHNPYDQYNYVTSIDPRFYSYELKKRTDMLVYIPYYSTAGGMSEAQATCSAYYQADRIIMQAEKYRKFYDPALPKEKLLPLGSPKFDRIIRICKNPPEPPADWKEKLEGKKVCFYNTSLGGMLANTEAFLKKMEYVFSCFKDREDVCLLWRPHPLFESTLESMRPTFKPAFDLLKNYFLEQEIGIYDNTPDITDTIALCDAYIGDTGTSVTSLFGIAGKPLFILDNNINSLPGPEDWRGRAIPGFSAVGDPSWMLAQGNKLYHALNGDYKYRYFCDLSEYAGGNYYLQVITIGARHYVCPANAQDIVVIHGERIEKRVRLNHRIEQVGAFIGAVNNERYLFLIPNNYPAIVRYDTENGELRYFTQHLDMFIQMVNGEKRIGGFCISGDYLYLASPSGRQVWEIQIETGEERVRILETEHSCGCMGLLCSDTDLWFLPYTGYVITRWNPETEEVWEYTNYPENLKCTHIIHGYECEDLPFGIPAFYGDNVYFPPCWGNRFVRLDKKSGNMEEWNPPFELPEREKNGYFPSGSKGYFVPMKERNTESEYQFFSVFDRKLYQMDLKTNEYREIPVEFQEEELKRHEPGFQENSEWMQYACEENAFNTLPDFLDGKITGNAFCKEEQVQAFRKIAANNDGTCGEKIHQFLSKSFRGN
ncbi:MAG: hypothetical protein HFH24_03580 [Ruminococcus sp.]|nr:hypothetical protein [Ruminococcus sp.]